MLRHDGTGTPDLCHLPIQDILRSTQKGIIKITISDVQSVEDKRPAQVLEAASSGLANNYIISPF